MSFRARSYRLGDMASMLGLELRGDPEVVVSGVAPLEEAGPGDMAFVLKPSYLELARGSKASAFLVGRFAEGSLEPCLISPRPSLDMIRVLRLFEESPCPERGVHPTAVLGRDVVLGKDVFVGPYVVLEDGVEVGDGACLMASCFVGRGSSIGEGSVIYPHVVIYPGVRIGKRVVIHSNSVIGSDGYGYERGEGGSHLKIPHLGGVLVGDDVEIGACVTVDRGTLGLTVIGDGTKIDNLVHIAHNVRIGRNVLVVAMTGIAGSARIEEEAVIGGQVGVKDHVVVGARAVVASRSGVTKDVPAGAMVSGFPAWDHRKELKVQALCRDIESLVERVRALEERLGCHEGTGEKAPRGG